MSPEEIYHLLACNVTDVARGDPPLLALPRGGEASKAGDPPRRRGASVHACDVTDVASEPLQSCNARSTAP